MCQSKQHCNDVSVQMALRALDPTDGPKSVSRMGPLIGHKSVAHMSAECSMQALRDAQCPSEPYAVKIECLGQGTKNEAALTKELETFTGVQEVHWG